MLVKLKYMDDSVESFQVEDSLTVGELKRKNSRTPETEQKLVFRGRVLRNEKTLLHYHISHEDVIHCVTSAQQTQGSARSFQRVQETGNSEGNTNRNPPNFTSIFGRSPSIGFGSSTHQTLLAPSSPFGRSTVQQTPSGPASSGEPLRGIHVYHFVQRTDEETNDSDEDEVESSSDEENEMDLQAFNRLVFGDGPTENSNPRNRRILTARRRAPQNQGHARQHSNGSQSRSSTPNMNGTQQQSRFPLFGRLSAAEELLQGIRARNASHMHTRFQPQETTPGQSSGNRSQPAYNIPPPSATYGFQPRSDPPFASFGLPTASQRSGLDDTSFQHQETSPGQSPNYRFQPAYTFPRPLGFQSQETTPEQSTGNRSHGFQPRSAPPLASFGLPNASVTSGLSGTSYQPQETSVGQRSQPSYTIPPPSGLFRSQPNMTTPPTATPSGTYGFQPRSAQPASFRFGQLGANRSTQSLGFQPRNQSTQTEQSRAQASGVTVSYVDSSGQTRELPLSQAIQSVFNMNRGREGNSVADPLPGIGRNPILATDSDDYFDDYSDDYFDM